MLGSFLKLLNGGEPGETVWTADITYWLAGQPADRIADGGWDTEPGYLRLCQELGCMPYYWYDKFWAAELESERVTTRLASSGETHLRIWETPVGSLRERSTYVGESTSRAITKHPVQSAEDLKVLLFILEHSRWVPVNTGDYPARMDMWAEYDGLPPIAMPRSPLPAFLVEWAGVQNGVYLMADEPDLVNACLRTLEALEAPVVDALCDLGPPLVHFPDNLTSETYTGLFDQHMGERYERRLARLHAQGTKCAVHLDGTTRGLLPKLTKAGIDAIEALTPKSAGDLSVAEMRQVAGSDSVILWGGVPGVMFSPPYGWVDIERHVHRTLEAACGTPFILGVADQVPPDGDISIVPRISDLVANWPLAKGRT